MKTALAKLRLAFLILSCFLLISCNCKDEPFIKQFAFNELSPPAIGEINDSDGTIVLTVPYSTDVKNLSPTIDVGDSDCHTVRPLSGAPQDFTEPVIYQVTNKNGDVNQYEVSVQFQNPALFQEIIWESRARMPLPLGWMPAVVLNEKVYVIGGGVNETDVTNKMYVYDPVNDSWDDSRASIPIGRFAHSANVVDGKIYVMGGVSGPESKALSDILIYDPSKDKWENGGNMTFGRAAHGSCVIEDKIYLIGGELEEPTRNSAIDDVSLYDPGTKTWKTLAPLPTARAYLVAETVDGKIFAAGGTTGIPYDGSDIIEVYDPQSNTWMEKPNMLFARWALGSCVIDGKIFFVGGTPIPMNPGSTAVQVFNAGTNQWYTGTNLTQLRTGPATCSWQGQIIVLGGADSPAPWATNTDAVEVGIIPSLISR